MTEQEIQQIIEKQRKFFESGKTLPVAFRKETLKKLYAVIKQNESEIMAAVKKDLGKSAMESFMCEVGLVLEEISFMLKHVAKYAKKQVVKTPLAQFASKSYKNPSPRGVVLIMSPWNYPFMLTLSPLVDAIASGNTVIIKPSAYSANTSKIIEEIFTKNFAPEYISVVSGGRAENECLLNQKFDYIFFTGSKVVGKTVMQKAAQHLTPVTLELGGKSPCVVEKSANLKLAAKRIVFGKFLNCGQTCVAPDFIYCDKSIKDELVKNILEEIEKQFGQKPLENQNFGKIINQKHFERLLGLIQKDKVVFGGNSDSQAQRIEPTVMDNVLFSDPVMKEEIFGPIMPILTFENIEECVTKVQQMEHPLAFYIFTSNKKLADRVISLIGFGGGCINDTIIHLATTQMGFGGFGESGMGSYHGKVGFDTFSHYKSIVDKKTWMDLPMRYQPYQKIYDKMIRMFLK